MKAKSLISLLPALILTAGVAVAQQPAPPAAPSPPDEPSEQNFSIFIDGGGYLGVYAENINRENMGRYNLNQVRGVGVTQVVKDSPAEKAGLRKDDVILRIDGENVNSVRKLNRLISEMAPDHSVRVSVSRNGAETEITATIGKRSNSAFAQDLIPGGSKLWKWEGTDPKVWKWEGPLFNREDFRNNGDFALMLMSGRRIGVSTMELSRQLAEYFGIAGGKGVLVTAVTEDGPAAKAGVKAGDVITAIDGEAVDSTGDISRVVNRKKEGDVTLTVIRNKAQQTIRVTPQEGKGFSGTLGQPTVGRRIVIPRIAIPMPDVNISMPRIVIPAVPAVDIRMPPVRVRTPRIRIVRGEQGPI
jgi:serine protease Do